MRKHEGMSLLAKFCLVMALIVLLAGAVIYELTGRLSRSTFTLSDRKELESAAQTAREKLALYNSGWLWQMELQSIVNPTINPGDVFLLLADSSGRVIAYTELGVPYFGSSKLRYYLEQLRTGSAINLSVQDNNSLVLIHGERTEAGDYILAGKPLRVFQWTLANFRNKLLLWLVPVLLLLIAVFAIAGRRAMRPLKALKAAAQDVEQGKAALVTTDMPGEMADVASAFNHMSAQVSKTIRDLNQEKENMLRILEGLSEGVLTMTEDGRVLQRNRACLTLLGGEDAPAYQEVSDALRAALKQKREGSGKLNQGKTVLQYDITMLPGLDGQNGAIACIRDITEGERLSRTRYDYVANISHELRTPLANMRGLAEGLRDGLVTDEQERMRYYGIIVDEVRRLSRLVNDLLELSGLQSNPAAFEMEKVEPTEIMWELFDLNKKSFAEKRQTLSLEVPEEELPSIITNEDRLTEVLTIFLDNARKYTPEGGKIVLGAELSETDGIVTGVRFFVRDNGIGMDEESSRLVFERFHQADKSHAGQGSGLGLSIAREILLKLNVQIQLKTKPGEGSEFSFVLPVP